MPKIILAVISGLGGLPTSILHNKTALEAANKPNLDYLAEKGQTGFAKNFTPKDENFIKENASNYAIINLLGVNPETTSWKKGPIQAVGLGMGFKEGNVAASFNYAYINQKGIVEDRKAGKVSYDELERYSKEIKEKINYSGEYELSNGVLILKSRQPLGEDVAGSDPLTDGQTVRQVTPISKLESSARTSAMLKAFEQKANEILTMTKLNTGRRTRGGYPITRIITSGIGTKLPGMPLHEDFAAICATPTEKGISKLSGMKILGLEKPSGDYKKDADETLELLKQHYDEHDKIVIFMKGPSVHGLGGESNKKKQAIEYLDKTIISFLKEKINLKEDVICVTSDYATPTRLMKHATSPIPLLISGKINPDNTTRFGEKHCRNGQLGEMKGHEILPFLYKLYRQ